MNRLTLIKLGGSLITDKSKPFTSRPAVIQRLGQEIKAALSQHKELKIILAHGSGSFGHVPAAKYGTADGFRDEFGKLGACITHDVAAQINRIVTKELLEVGLPVVGIPPSAIFITAKGKLKRKFLEPVLILLKNGIIPVLYGDVIWDEKQGSAIFSGETSLKMVAEDLTKTGWKIDRDIQCGIEDGVLDQNGKVIPQITPVKFAKLNRLISGSRNADVTGGMLHKVKEGLEMAKHGINTLIISGIRPNRLYKTVMGEKVVGTLITS